MTTYANQTIGSFDNKSNEWVEIWFDENWVKEFSFHSIMHRDVMGNSHRVFGVIVEARHIFGACKAFNGSPELAINPNGAKHGVTHVWMHDGSEELRIGGKHGTAIARMTKTGYVQSK